MGLFLHIFFVESNCYGVQYCEKEVILRQIYRPGAAAEEQELAGPALTWGLGRPRSGRARAVRRFPPGRPRSLVRISAVAKVIVGTYISYHKLSKRYRYTLINVSKVRISKGIRVFYLLERKKRSPLHLQGTRPSVGSPQTRPPSPT